MCTGEMCFCQNCHTYIQYIYKPCEDYETCLDFKVTDTFYYFCDEEYPERCKHVLK